MKSVPFCYWIPNALPDSVFCDLKFVCIQFKVCLNTYFFQVAFFFFFAHYFNHIFLVVYCCSIVCLCIHFCCEFYHFLAINRCCRFKWRTASFGCCLLFGMVLALTMAIAHLCPKKKNENGQHNFDDDIQYTARLPAKFYIFTTKPNKILFASIPIPVPNSHS